MKELLDDRDECDELDDELDDRDEVEELEEGSAIIFAKTVGSTKRMHGPPPVFASSSGGFTVSWLSQSTSSTFPERVRLEIGSLDLNP